MPRAAILAVLGFAFVSCSGPTAPSASDTRITGITWKLRSIQPSGAPAIEIRNPDRFTVLLGGDHRAAVRADCNACTGRYELNGSTLQLGSLACTRAFCGVESPDMQFLDALLPSASVAISGGMLKLSATDTVLLFEQ
jgi:heat shock protein HslJ